MSNQGIHNFVVKALFEQLWIVDASTLGKLGGRICSVVDLKTRYPALISSDFSFTTVTHPIYSMFGTLERLFPGRRNV
jgi:hypothetical protein